MSDTSKAEKLAAARRKLKEFQNQQKTKDCNSNANGQIHRLRDSGDTESNINPSAAKPERQVSELAMQSVVSPETNSTEQARIYQSTLANYFPSYDKTNFAFDSIQKSINDQTNSSQPENFHSLPSSYFSANTDGHFLPVSSGLSVYEANESNIIQNEEKCWNKDERLKQELAASEANVQLQREALDIMTSEREDLQKKLQIALNEMKPLKESTQVLQKRLEQSLSNEEELKATIDDLRNCNEKVVIKDLAMEQNLNDLKEKNDELCHSLEIQKEKNADLQKRFEETQSNYDMLALKFQQLGLEVENDKNYHSVNEECDSWKRKCVEFEEKLRALTFERERTNDEYRQYVDDLKIELEETNSELKQLSSENQTLLEKMSSQTEHIGQLEKQLQRPLKDANNESNFLHFTCEIENLKKERDEHIKIMEELRAKLVEYESSVQRCVELERQIENMKTEIMGAGELQEAIESNKVAASLAIAQNNKLKVELENLQKMVEVLNGEKNILFRMLEEEKTKNSKLNNVQEALRRKSGSDITTNDAAINTDINNGTENSVYGRANVEAMLQLQEKFKSVLEKMADLTDEKQQLEHLVLQLQCETETIEEYVALYQKQRSVLQQRARDTDFKMERVGQEKERLLNILHSILNTEQFDCNFVRKLIEDNLSTDLTNEVNNYSKYANTNGNDQRIPFQSNSSHHPSCPCCSGSLITI